MWFTADSTAADDAPQRRSLHCLRNRLTEHVGGVEGGQPEAVRIRVVVTRPLVLTLDKRHLAEIFQTRARRNQRLSGSLCSNTRLHDKGVSSPQGFPACRTVWHHGGLAVDGQDVGAGFTHRTPADVGGQSVPSDGAHVCRHRLGSGQPVGEVIARRKAAGTFSVTEQEGNGGKTRETASHASKVLTVSFLIAIDVEKRVTREDEVGANGAVRDADGLTVSGYQEALHVSDRTSAGQAWETLEAWTSRSAIWTWKSCSSFLSFESSETWQPRRTETA